MSRPTSLVLAFALVATMAGASHHQVDLTRLPGKVHVYEGQEARFLAVSVPQYESSLEVRTNDKGAPVEHRVSFGGYIHWDLNGDGTIDARFHHDTNIAEVWFENAWVRVTHTKDAFKSRNKRAYKGDDDFTFRDGKWAVD